MPEFSFEYNFDFIHTVNIFSYEEKEVLHEINSNCKLSSFLSDQSLINKLGFEFVYTSAKIEGSTVSRKDTSIILDTGTASSGTPINDAVMILNLDKAYKYIAKNNLTPDFHTMGEVHTLLAYGLLKNPKDVGGMKNRDNWVNGCNYHPLPPGSVLRTETESIFSTYATLTDPFDRALYMHNNVAYMQYFADCNKRTARCMQFISMKHDNVMPLMLLDKDDKSLYEKYIDSLVEYYTTGNYEKSKKYFIDNYITMGNFIKNSEINLELDKYVKNPYMVISCQDPEKCEQLASIGKEAGLGAKKLRRYFLVEPDMLKKNQIDLSDCKVYESIKHFFIKKEISEEKRKLLCHSVPKKKIYSKGTKMKI